MRKTRTEVTPAELLLPPQNLSTANVAFFKYDPIFQRGISFINGKESAA